MTESAAEAMERIAWTWIVAMVVAIAALLLNGCGLDAHTMPWEGRSYREVWPDTAPGCITVWAENGCRVGAYDGEPGDCATGDDVLIYWPAYHQPPSEGCRYGTNHSCNCSDRRIP